MVSWESQLHYTPLLVEAWIYSRPLPGPGFAANKAKAARILAGELPLDVLRGPKVRAFYRSILTGGRDIDPQAVCIDRHAYALAFGLDSADYLTPKRYAATAAAFVQACAALQLSFPSFDLSPAKLQALCWCWWRDNPTDRF